MQKFLETIKGQIDELKTKAASLPKKPILTVTANCCDPCPPHVCEVCYDDVVWINTRIDNMWNEIYRVYDALYKHANPATHLPPIQGAGQMKKILEVLSMDSDYSVEPKTIYASNGEIKDCWLEIRRKE